MNDSPKAEGIGIVAGVPQPEWQTPVLTEDRIADSTHHTPAAPGIDNYEASNAAYGS